MPRQVIDQFLPVQPRSRSRAATAAYQRRPVSIQSRLRQHLTRPIGQRPQAAKPQVSEMPETSRGARRGVPLLKPAPKPGRPYANPRQSQSWLDKHPRLQHLTNRLQLPLVIIGGMIGGVLVQSLVAGQIILAIYAIVALIFRIDSRTTFVAAFLSVCALVGLIVFKGGTPLATNLAVYSFILLIIGAMTLWRELRESYA